MQVPDQTMEALLLEAGHQPGQAMTADTLRRYTNGLMGLVEGALSEVRNHYKDRPAPMCRGDELIKSAAVAVDNCTRAVAGAMELQ